MTERTWFTYVVPSEHRRINEFVGLVLATVAILIALSLVSFNPDDPSFNISRSPNLAARPTNFVGVVGAYGSDIFLQTCGYSAFLLPIFLGVYAFYWLASWPVKHLWIRIAGMILLITTVATALGMLPLRVQDHILAGGMVGKSLADTLQASFNRTGSVVVLMSAFLISLFLSTKFSFATVVVLLKPRFSFISNLNEKWTKWQTDRARANAIRKAEIKKEKTPRKQTIVTERDEGAAPTEPRREPVVAAAAEAVRATILPRRKPSAAAPSSTEFPSTSLLHAPPAAVSYTHLTLPTNREV